MLSGAVYAAVRKSVYAPLGGSGGFTIPRTDLLFYLARPNSDEYLIGEETEVGEDTYIWGFYTGTDETIRAATGWTVGNANVFYDADGDPVVALASEILASPGINTAHILFKSISVERQEGKLAIYNPTTDAAILAKAKAVLKI
jgi:hypothetical protein